MELLNRKHFSLWITFLLTSLIDNVLGLQGVPTWMCLGIKSPFIEFQAEIEILANTSVSLNITKDDQALMHQEGLQKLGTFIKPIDLRNSTTGYVKANLTKKLAYDIVDRRKGITEHPITEEMNRKEIELLEDESDPSIGSAHETGFPSSINDDRKYIVPMALKNPAGSEIKKSIPQSAPSQSQPAVQSSGTVAAAAGASSSSSLNQDFSTNIADLKNHILMLQNRTKNDKNFQSKFVVFPSLQRERQENNNNKSQTTTTSRPMTKSKTASPRPWRLNTPSNRKISSSGGFFRTTTTTTTNRPLPDTYDNDEHDFSRSSSSSSSNLNYQKEKITIVPQVLLLNDQTPPDDDAAAETDDEENDDDDDTTNNDQDMDDPFTSMGRRRNGDRNKDADNGRLAYRKTVLKSTTTPSSVVNFSTINTTKPRRTPKRQRSGGGGNGGDGDRTAGGGEKRNKKNKRKNCKNADNPQRCQQRRRQQRLLAMQVADNKNKNFDSIKSTFVSNPTGEIGGSRRNEESTIKYNGDSIWSSLSSAAAAAAAAPGAISSRRSTTSVADDQKLLRSVRSSNHKRRNAAGGSMKSSGYMAADEGQYQTRTRDFIIPVGNVINNNQSLAYREHIDLNPDNCYKVGGLSYAQQKLCVIHTTIMPPISRGARSAIQECKHQLKNRRWNCSTTEDDTVFGPISSIGSPEMAFIHSLAAAAATSFIARACRDGQLASCGCSRSSRPKQLHDDWTWGGCGDDLEFAYKFSQNFIDIREKERKRGTRGLVSVPSRSKLEEKLLSETDNGNMTGMSGINSTGIQQKNSDKDSSNSTTGDVSPDAVERNTYYNKNDENPNVFKPEDLLELQEKITKEILNSKLQEKEMLELQEKINREILNSKVFNLEHHALMHAGKRQQHQKNGGIDSGGMGRIKNPGSVKARSLMNLHNNEAGRRAVIKKTRITCKCHGVSGSCSLITCWQQLSSIREIGDYLREKYDEATQVKLNKRGRLQVKDPRYKVPTAHDLVYLEESPDWCRSSRQLQWPGTHGRVCNKTSSGLDGCAILCCGRGYNTKKIIVRERCNCKFHWCCQVKCEICVKVIEEHTCK